MSIIYEALKKVESKIKSSDKIELPYKKNKIHPFSKFQATLLYISVISLGFISAAFLSFLFTNQLHSKFTPTKPLNRIDISQIPENTNKTDGLLKTESKQTVKTIKPNLVLNGVFFSEDEGYALINNKILQKGDIIDRALVKNITPQKVELEYEGETITLEVK